MIQKSAIVFGLGPFEHINIIISKNFSMDQNLNDKTVNKRSILIDKLPWVAIYVRLSLLSYEIPKKTPR